MSTPSDHIEVSLDAIRIIFQKASDMIEAIPAGEKIPATKLAEVLADTIGITGPELYPTLKFLFKDYPNILIKRGAQGGIYKLPLNVPTPKTKPETDK